MLCATRYSRNFGGGSNFRIQYFRVCGFAPLSGAGDGAGMTSVVGCSEEGGLLIASAPTPALRLGWPSAAGASGVGTGASVSAGASDGGLLSCAAASAIAAS